MKKWSYRLFLHRGWTSSQGCYIVFNQDLRKVIKVFTFHHDRTARQKDDIVKTLRTATTDSSSGG